MFWRLRNSIARFMAGRYGMDSLGWFLLICWCICNVAVSFLPGVLYWLGRLASLGLLFWLYWRALSRQTQRRQAENERYLRLRRRFVDWGRRQVDRVRYIGRYRFRQCPYCRARLRLPIRRGRRTVTCARCNGRFQSFFL